MRFDTLQQEMLATTLDSLLCYVNNRFHVVREADGDDGECELRSQLVERYLWEHRELIDEFVRDNPDNLPKTHLDIAADLTGTLYGTLYLEERGKGEATIVHHTGVYTVASPNGSFFSHLPDECLELRGAIAPFRDMIVPIPPFAVIGRIPKAHLVHLHDELRQRGTSRPTANACVLATRARAWRDACERERNRSKTPVPTLGPTFHRGVLAGLDRKERDRLLQARAERARLERGTFQQVMDALSIEVDGLPTTTAEALLRLEDDWIYDIASNLAGDSTPPVLPTKLLASWIEEQLMHDEEELAATLTWCLDEQFDLIWRLLETNPLPLDDLPPSNATHLFPMIPYTFVLRQDDALRAWMPERLRAAIVRLDLTSIRDIRARLSEARAAARGLATMCGIIGMSDAYERYCHVASRPLSRQQFEAALDELQDCESRDDYALWRHKGHNYVISVEISDASAAARVTRESYADHIVNDIETPDGSSSPLFVGLSVEDEDEFSRRVAQKQEELERSRLSLLACKRPLAPAELPERMLRHTPLCALMRLEALEALRAFVDAHVPDGQDDYEFAETFCRSVIVSSVLMCESYNDTMDLIRLYGMEGCEGTDYSHTLGRLVTNAYNALPRWDLNGWSLEQNTERITGRRRFFNEDGTQRELGDDDPCPCASGKPYKNCCGHLR